MAVTGDPYNLGILEWELPLGKLGTVGNAQLLSAMMAVGPIVMGCAMLVIFNDRKSWRWPFHKDKVVGSFGFGGRVDGGGVAGLPAGYGLLRAEPAAHLMTVGGGGGCVRL